MKSRQLTFLALNVIGGISVIGSYIYGLNAQDGGADALWGGVPESTRIFYFVSMVVSALGYFAFLYLILFRVALKESSFGVFYLIFALILIPSAFWMPLTNIYLNNPSESLWLVVRGVLLVVGLASITLLWALLRINKGKDGLVYRLAILGAGYFAFHTTILDALIWPVLFR